MRRPTPPAPPAAARWIEGGVTAAHGFQAAGVACGIKKFGTKDLGVLYSAQDAAAAGLFTSNRVRAAPLLHCARVLHDGRARALVVNSGNANACTGTQGERDTQVMAELTARALGCEPAHVLVASTGVIGVPLPMVEVEQGISSAVRALGGDGSSLAEAIMTTDTRPKSCALELDLSGGTVRIGGIAKGAGMIGPRLAPSGELIAAAPHATLLAFVTTDAALAADALAPALRVAGERSFNAITVDGDTSTNDSFLVLANGASGVALEGPEDIAAFAAGLEAVAKRLALEIVCDGEGAHRLLEITVGGARDPEQARQAAMTIANSPLVKTAFVSGEPNWGRLMMALGRSGAELDCGRVAISIGRLQVVREGQGAGASPEAIRSEMTRDEVPIAIELGLGDGQATVWTSDLSEEYVRINAHYLT